MIQRALSIVFVLAFAGLADAQGNCCSNPFCWMKRPGWEGRARLATTLRPMLEVQRPLATPAPVPVVEPPIIDSTPDVVVAAMVRELGLTPEDVLYDLGCGDGRILIYSVREYGCKAVGIEVDPAVAAIARRNVERAGLAGKIRIVTGDARSFKLDGATAVTMYLYPSLMRQLLPKIGTRRIVSYSHQLPGIACKELMVEGRYPIYVALPALAGTEGLQWSWLANL